MVSRINHAYSAMGCFRIRPEGPEDCDCQSGKLAMPLLKGLLKNGGATDSTDFARAIVARLNSRLWTR